ncbi:MAG: hypothetical protein NZ518_09880 [Dehalococcoidia bacterium]|nr:hypothetical protein [Dehalococcoidia bacterium]
MQPAQPQRHFVPPPTGLEGRELEFGRAMRSMIQIFQEQLPYEHQFNDALVKAILTGFEFARKHNLVAEWTQHQIETLHPVLKRVKAIMERSGDAEMAMVGVFDRPSCHVQLLEYTEKERGARTFPCPFKRVYDQSSKLGQHNFTLEEFHEQWCKATWQGYAQYLGVEAEVTPCDGGMVTVRLTEESMARVATPAEASASR